MLKKKTEGKKGAVLGKEKEQFYLAQKKEHDGGRFMLLLIATGERPFRGEEGS